MGNDVAGGSGRAYVARTRELAAQAYRKWHSHMERGAAISVAGKRAGKRCRESRVRC